MNKEKPICQLCQDDILEYEPQIRIGADLITQDSGGQCISLMSNNVLVFAYFHAECIEGTQNSSECDSVEYIGEARQLANWTTAQKDEGKTLSMIAIQGATATN